MHEIPEGVGFDFDPDDGSGECGYCGGEGCPACCDNLFYAPGTEECDFCRYSDECAREAASGKKKAR